MDKCINCVKRFATDPHGFFCTEICRFKFKAWVERLDSRWGLDGWLNPKANSNFKSAVAFVRQPTTIHPVELY